MLLILYFRMWGVKYTHHRFVEYVRRVIMRLRSKRASDTGKEQDKGSERWILYVAGLIFFVILWR